MSRNSMLGTVELLRLVKEINLIENLSDREMENPEGAGFDLRAGEFFKQKSDEEVFIGVEKRSTPTFESIIKHNLNEKNNNEIVIKPGEYYAVKTIEILNLPKNISVIIRPRSTLQRGGVILVNAAVHPGYCGGLTMGIFNAGKNNCRIELGARIAHILFFRTGENVSSYRGQWQGGRVSTDGKSEIQV